MSAKVYPKLIVASGLVVVVFLAAQAVSGRSVVLAPTGGESKAAGMVFSSDWAERHPGGLYPKSYAGTDWADRHPGGQSYAETYDIQPSR